MYANDTVVFVTDRDINYINSKLSSDLAILHKWLNPLRKSYHISLYQPITIYNEPLIVVNKYKYLGLILDANLTYTLHVEKVLKQIKRLFVFQKTLPDSCPYVYKCSHTLKNVLLLACLVFDIELNFKTC